MKLFYLTKERRNTVEHKLIIYLIVFNRALYCIDSVVSYLAKFLLRIVELFCLAFVKLIKAVPFVLTHCTRKNTVHSYV